MTVIPPPPLAGPAGHFLLGQLPALGRDWLGALGRYAAEYGDLVPLRLGPRRGLLINRPDLIEAVLIAHNRDVVKSPALRHSRRLLGNGLVTSEGEFWRRQRRLIQPAFHKTHLAAYAAVMIRYAEEMLADWDTGREIEAQETMSALTLRVVARTLFDADVTGAAHDVGEAMAVVLERFNRRLGSLLFLASDALPIPGNFAYLRAAARLDRILRDIIERRRASGEQRDDLLAVLLRARDAAGGGMTDRQLRDELMTLFLAGHETTATALTWIWYLLAQHPRAEARLHAELAEVLGGRTPTPGDVPRLAYTGRVVVESMRLYPPIWAIAREAIRDLELGGHRVRRGTVLLMSQWVMHRDARYYDRPLAFEPERWADGRTAHLPRFAYFPFGGGPRQCIGNGFATLEATLVLATLAQHARLRLVPGQTPRLLPSATLRPRDGLHFTVERRD